MKKLFLIITTASLLFSCGEVPLRNSNEFSETGSSKKKRKRTELKDSTKTQEVKHDTIVKSDTVTIEKTIAYKCKYPDLVQKILLEKRTQIFEKEGRDISFYSDAFLDIFDVEKTKTEILMFYDKMIDSSLTKFSLRGKIDFNNINNNVKPIIK
jgi:hypothetical protein